MTTGSRGSVAVGQSAPAVEGFHFDAAEMDARGSQLHDKYLSADPFPHIVMDDFLPSALIDKVVSEFPGPQDIPWQLFEDGGRTLKLATEDQDLMGEFTRRLFSELNGPAFLGFLQNLTGISGLVPDPYLFGGGLHQIEPGGFLEVHADFNIHPILRLHRRLNLLLYLNEDWQDEWEGHLELWATDMSRCVQRVAPIRNRCVIFNTMDRSFHGHPARLACPTGRNRRSLALYYYSAERAAGTTGAEHSTLYQTGAGVPAGGLRPEGSAWRARIRPWVPPAVVELSRKARSRRGGSAG